MAIYTSPPTDTPIIPIIRRWAIKAVSPTTVYGLSPESK